MQCYEENLFAVRIQLGTNGNVRVKKIDKIF